MLPLVMLGSFKNAKTDVDYESELSPLVYNERGHAIYRVKATEIGNFTVRGYMKFLSPAGIFFDMLLSCDYQVVE